MDRQQAELVATAGGLAGELAAQGSLAAELARAPAAADRAREAWVRRRNAVISPVILSDARVPLAPGAPHSPVVIALGGVTGLLLGAALALVQQHRATAPQRLAEALRLPLAARIGSRHGTDPRIAATRIAATLPPGPAEVAVIAAGGRRARSAANRLASDLAALSKRGGKVRLLLRRRPRREARRLLPCRSVLGRTSRHRRRGPRHRGPDARGAVARRDRPRDLDRHAHPAAGGLARITCSSAS